MREYQNTSYLSEIHLSRELSTGLLSLSPDLLHDLIDNLRSAIIGTYTPVRAFMVDKDLLVCSDRLGMIKRAFGHGGTRARSVLILRTDNDRCADNNQIKYGSHSKFTQGLTTTPSSLVNKSMELRF